jgi:hypothetical protein
MHAPLPVHPLTGLTAVGWRKARPGEDEGELYPIWPVLGGAEDDSDSDQGDDAGDDADGDEDQGDDADDGQDDDGDPDGADALGDRGKRALAAMKGKWKSERDKRRALEQQLSGNAKGDDDAVAKATAAATAAANSRILRAEIRAVAKGRLADPKDALTFLNLDDFEVDEDGQVDEDEIAEAIDGLLKNKPYLAAQGGRRFQGTGDGGAARKAGKPKQLTREDLRGMSAEAILKAKSEGRLDEALGINR